LSLFPTTWNCTSTIKFWVRIYKITSKNVTNNLNPYRIHQKTHHTEKKTSMANKMISSLLQLPVELVYRILDNLDEKSIFLSSRNVCIRLNIIIDTYHRYQVTLSLDFWNKLFILSEVLLMSLINYIFQTRTQRLLMKIEKKFSPLTYWSFEIWHPIFFLIITIICLIFDQKVLY